MSTYIADILVVDDMPNNLKVLMTMLKDAGYKVRSVLSGEMALTAAHTAPPDLVLLDINMPVMNGYEVCEAFKSVENLRDIPIIFITALDADVDQDHAIATGAVDFIMKPFRLDEVLEKIEYHLRIT
jgi:PleD family two-component response regulator